MTSKPDQSPPSTPVAEVVEDPNVLLNALAAQDVANPTITRTLFDGDIVIKRQPPRDWEYVPAFGTVMKQPACPNVEGNQPKTFNVRWELNNLVERVRPEQVSVVDRFVMRNTKVENDQGVVGTVRDWNVRTSVQIIGTNHVIEKVGLDRLRPITSFIRGQEILYKDWVGVITIVKRNIWFQLDGGMGFYIVVTEKDGFMRADPYWGVGMPCPGIRTKLNASVIRKAKWVSGPMQFFSKLLPPLNYLYSFANVTLNKSEVTEVEVNWLRVAPNAPNSAPKPVEKLDREMLRSVTVIGMPSSETVGINSVRMLKLRPEDYITTYQSWLAAYRKKFIDGVDGAEPIISPITMAAPLRVLATERVYEVPVKILSRTTMVEVEWSDGTREKSHSVKIPKLLHRRDDTEFPGGMLVSPMYSPYQASDLYGVILDSEEFVATQARKVNVMWILKGNPMEVRAESIFNLRPHSLYSMYERGTIVFPRVKGATKFKTAVVTDLNIASGKLVLTVTADHSQHEVYPHLVTPLECRCFWNFFTRQWAVDEIVVPPYQLLTEYGPHYADVAEPTPAVLSNNNQQQADQNIKSAWDEAIFEMLPFASPTHRYHNCGVPATGNFGKGLVSVMQNEIACLKKHGTLPEGIWVRCYENRMDLISAFMVGPTDTPYEDGIFMFDLQVTDKFPSAPPKIHYVSYSYELSPAMAWDGNFCVSALNWKREAITDDESYIAYCLKKMQALIFSPEPLMNGPREFIDSKNSRKTELSKLYNEFVVLRVLDSAWNMIHRPYDPWTDLIKTHFASVLPEKLAICEEWADQSSITHLHEPKYSLLPASAGFHEALAFRVRNFQKISLNLVPIRGIPSKIQHSVIDVTADSESSPVILPEGSQEITIELVDPVPQNANDEVAFALGPSTSVHHPDPESPIPSIGLTLPQTFDSEKNIINKNKNKKKAKKGKILPGFGGGNDTSASEVTTSGGEESEQDVAKVEKGKEDEIAGGTGTEEDISVNE